MPKKFFIVMEWIKRFKQKNALFTSNPPQYTQSKNKTLYNYGVCSFFVVSNIWLQTFVTILFQFGIPLTTLSHVQDTLPYFKMFFVLSLNLKTVMISSNSFFCLYIIQKYLHWSLIGQCVQTWPIKGNQFLTGLIWRSASLCYYGVISSDFVYQAQMLLNYYNSHFSSCI